MPLSLSLDLAMAPLAVGLHAIATSRWASCTRQVYGVSLAVCIILLGMALAHLLGDRTPITLTLPIGLPWLGAHFRLDALSAFPDRGQSRRRGGQLVRRATVSTSRRPNGCCRSTRPFWPA